MLLPQVLATTAGKNVTRAAFSYLGKDISYGDLRKRIGRLSYLLQNEVGHHARVAFITRNSPAVAIAFFALCNTRSVTIPMDPDLSDDELYEWLKASQATHVFCTNDLTPRVRDILRKQAMSQPIIEIEKKQGGEYDPVYTPPADQVPREEDPVLLLRTSGTSNEYKYCSFTHKQLQYCATAIKKPYHPGSTDRLYTPLGWSHPYAFTHGMLFPLLSGITCVIDHGLGPTELLDFFISSRVNRIVGTPKFFQQLLLVCRSQERTVVGVKSITVGAGSISQQMRKIFGLMKIAVVHCYGQTENLWTIFMGDTQEPTEEVGVAGRPLSGFKYKVLDPNGDEVEAKKGESRIGHLAMSGNCLMTGYYDKDDKKAAKESKNALRGTWLYTGDIAKIEGIDDEMKITYIGRKEELMLVEGVYISPEPIDGALKDIKGVQEGAGFIVKDRRNKPVMACAVVKREGSGVNEAQALSHLKSKLPPSVAPAVVVITDSLPKDFGGNVNRIRLSRQFSGIMG